MEYFSEEDYLSCMESVVAPFLEENLVTNSFGGYDGKPIAYGYLKNPKEKAAVVISHGYCEFIYKYHEYMYYLYQMGYSVFFIAHRGHGHSYREVEDELDMVHINSFDEYVEDLHIFVKEVVMTLSSTKELYLMGHSMGGAIAGRYIEKYPDIFKKVILSSPMMAMSFGSMPKALVYAVLFAAKILRWNRKYAVGQHGFDNSYDFASSAGESKARYDYAFKARQENKYYRSNGGSYGWMMAAVKVASAIRKDVSKVTAPVLLIQAGMDTLVLPEAQNYYAANSANTKICVFKDSKHEIFNSSDENIKKYFDMVFDFYDN